MHSVSIPAWALARGEQYRPPRPIEPKRTAVLVIDLQNYFITPGMPMANPHAYDMLPTANRAIRMLRDAGCLIVFTLNEADPAPADNATRGAIINDMRAYLSPGAPSFDLHPDVDIQPTDRTVIKRRPSVFHPLSHVDRAEMFAGRDIDTIVILGVVTNGCCECTARDAYQHGYHVLFSADGTAALTNEEHNAALLNLACYFANVLTADQLEERLQSSTAGIALLSR